MTKSSVHPLSALAASLRTPAVLAHIVTAVMSILLLSACASAPWYDTPPYMPVKMSPLEGAVVNPGKPVVFAWDSMNEADTYDFHIFNAETSDIDQYMLTGLKPSEICSGGTCSVSLPLSLPDSDRHAWRVRAANMAGQSAWTRSIFTFSSTVAQ